MEVARVYPNHHVRIISNSKLNKGPYISYPALQKLLDEGTEIKFETSTTKIDITDLMIRRIKNQIEASQITCEFYKFYKPREKAKLKWTNDDNDFDPYSHQY